MEQTISSFDNPMDWDQYGHCAKCHTNLLIEQVIDNRVQRRFSADHGQIEFLLNDGSRMRVCVCKPCQSSLTDKDKEYLMQCVKNGWQKEVDSLAHWSEEKKKFHMEQYNKLDIVARSEKIRDDEIEDRVKEFSKKKIKGAK